MEVSDADVIGASIDEPARFGTIFDRHATALRRYLARRLRATARLAHRWVDKGDHAERLATDLDNRRSLEAAAEAVTALPPVERDTVILFAWEELSYDDIARALGVPVGTVRSRLNRARKRLREPHQPGGQEPDNRLGHHEPGRMGP